MRLYWRFTLFPLAVGRASDDFHQCVHTCGGNGLAGARLARRPLRHGAAPVSLVVRSGRDVSYRARALRQELFPATLLAFQQPTYPPARADDL